MAADDLPLIDEHDVLIEADVDAVWAALADTLDGTFGGIASVYARAVGCADATAAGPRPLATSSTFPGFRVVGAIPCAELALEGRHRFSTYALTFRLDELGPMQTKLRAESRASFPGVLGAGYRALVVGTRGHVLAVRRLLGSVRKRAEADA